VTASWLGILGLHAPKNKEINRQVAKIAKFEREGQKVDEYPLYGIAVQH